MTVNDVTNFYTEHYQPTLVLSNKIALNLPIIEAWYGVVLNHQAVIRGRVYNHPTYSQGIKIKTSPIQKCHAKSGHVYVSTKNSMYELGIPQIDFVEDSRRSNTSIEPEQWENVTDWN